MRIADINNSVTIFKTISRVKFFLPDFGQVGILYITDKQFGNMELFSEHKPKESEDIYIQLELFLNERL